MVRVVIGGYSRRNYGSVTRTVQESSWRNVWNWTSPLIAVGRRRMCEEIRKE